VAAKTERGKLRLFEPAPVAAGEMAITLKAVKVWTVHCVMTAQDTRRIELALPPGVSVTVVGVKVRAGAPSVGVTVVRRERVPVKPPRLVTVIVSGTTAPIGTLIEDRVEATLKLQTLIVTFARVPK
jgi:hypothetical protein